LTNLSEYDIKWPHFILIQEVNTTLDQKEAPVVKVGSTVTFVDEEGNEYTFTLSPANANPVEDEISIHSPVGKALVGAKLGEKVTVQAPKGEYQIEIIKLI
jgi:transcription elongation factor GreA